MYVGCFSDGAFSDTSTFSTSHPPVFLHAGETHFRFRVFRHVQFHPALARPYLSSYGPCSVFDLFYPTHLQFTNENTVHKARILQKSRNYKGTTKKQSSRDQSVWGPLQRVQRSAIGKCLCSFHFLLYFAVLLSGNSAPFFSSSLSESVSDSLLSLIISLHLCDKQNSTILLPYLSSSRCSRIFLPNNYHTMKIIVFIYL
ncbi:hypothetical protein C8Q75DRAFT_497016 [Abortiporus biennis]|nr:hypothetical protein C8Q75DRAFT_497016 [Abortiporus biennis]